jgi:CheY-like chemotaxis protein
MRTIDSYSTAPLALALGMADSPKTTPVAGVASLRESEAPAQISRIEELAETLAHEVNNPLAAMVANLDFLEESLSRIAADCGGHIETAEARAWLGSRLHETQACLRDAREAAHRISVVVRQLGPVQRSHGAIVDRTEGTLSPPRAPSEAEARVESGCVRKASVLIIDDEQSIARALARLLREYDVLVVLNPLEALARIVRGERYDVVVCDMTMPEMSGSALHGQIMRVAPEQARQMIFITGGAMTTETNEFLAAVEQPVLIKPFEAAALRSLIRSFLR